MQTQHDSDGNDDGNGEDDGVKEIFFLISNSFQLWKFPHQFWIIVQLRTKEKKKEQNISQLLQFV